MLISLPLLSLPFLLSHSITSLSLYCATDDDSCIAIKMFDTKYLVQSKASEVLHRVDHLSMHFEVHFCLHLEAYHKIS